MPADIEKKILTTSTAQCLRYSKNYFKGYKITTYSVFRKKSNYILLFSFL